MKNLFFPLCLFFCMSFTYANAQESDTSSWTYSDTIIFYGDTIYFQTDSFALDSSSWTSNWVTEGGQIKIGPDGPEFTNQGLNSYISSDYSKNDSSLNWFVPFYMDLTNLSDSDQTKTEIKIGNLKIKSEKIGDSIYVSYFDSTENVWKNIFKTVDSVGLNIFVNNNIDTVVWGNDSIAGQTIIIKNYDSSYVIPYFFTGWIKGWNFFTQNYFLVKRKMYLSSHRKIVGHGKKQNPVLSIVFNEKKKEKQTQAMEQTLLFELKNNSVGVLNDCQMLITDMSGNVLYKVNCRKGDLLQLQPNMYFVSAVGEYKNQQMKLFIH